jgi:hypothetical protein
MRSLTATGLLFLIAACSSATTSTPGGGSSTDDETTGGSGSDAAVAAPPTISGSYVFQAANCSGLDVAFIGYKETVTIADGKATSVTETSGCKGTISGAPVRWVSATTFEIVYSAGTQACAPNPCNLGYDVIVGGTRSTVPPTKCENGPVLITGGTPPKFSPSGDTLQASMTLSGTQCTGQYIKL